MEVVIITGMSGAGRSRAADWFEDQGYYCVDNMPPALINNFLEMASSAENNIEKAAFVADLRSGNFFGELIDVIDELRDRGDIELTVSRLGRTDIVGISDVLILLVDYVCVRVILMHYEA